MLRAGNQVFERQNNFRWEAQHGISTRGIGRQARCRLLRHDPLFGHFDQRGSVTLLRSATASACRGQPEKIRRSAPSLLETARFSGALHGSGCF